MPKKILTTIKLQVKGGQANPAPPVGPVLGQHGVQIQDFCNKFNDATKEKVGEIVPVVITVYEDRSFDFIMKTPPAAELLKKAAGITRGSQKPSKESAGSVTKTQIKEIAEKKMPDLNANDIDAAMKIIEGTAKQMGLEVK